MVSFERTSFSLVLLFCAVIVDVKDAHGQVDALGDFIPHAVSEDGSIAVGALPTGEFGQAAYWTDSLGVVELPAPIAGEESSARGVSADGRIIAGDAGIFDAVDCNPGGLSYDPAKFVRPFTKSDQGVTTISPPAPGFCHYVSDLSADGTTIVGTKIDTVGGSGLFPNRAYLLNNGNFTYLHDDRFETTLAKTATGHGSAVYGYGRLVGGGTQAWRSSGSVLTTLFEGIPADVTPDDSVLVAWKQNVGIVRIEGDQETLLAPNFQFREASISDDGETIVFATQVGNSDFETSIWTRSGGAVPLADYLNQLGIDRGSWSLKWSTPTISGDGRYVFGYEPGRGAWRVELRCASEPQKWIQAGGGAFETPAHWESGTIPPDTSVVLFDTGSTYTLTLSQPRTDSDFSAEGDVILFQLSQNVYELTGTCAGTSLKVGSGGEVTLSDGSVHAWANVSVLEGLAPTLSLESNAILLVDSDGDGSGQLTASATGNALIRLEQGTSVNSPNSTILGTRSGESGELSIAGAFTGGSVIVGDEGDGELVVESTGFTNVDALRVGSSGTGSASVDGGELVVSGDVTVAEGAGSSGSELSFTNLGIARLRDVFVGQRLGSTGTVTVDSSLLYLSGTLALGEFGVGRLTISGGTSVNPLNPVGSLVLGLQPGSFGSASVTGNTSELWAQSITIGDAGDGEFIVRDAAIYVQSIQMGFEGSGLLDVDSSTNIINSLSVGPNATIIVDGIVIIAPASSPKNARGESHAEIQADTLVISGRPSITADSVIVEMGGVLGGDGTYPFDLTSSGETSPGTRDDPTATLEVDGNFVQLASGTTVIEIGGGSAGDFDQLRVTGTASLGGRLEVRVAEGYLPKIGQTFEILSATSIDGQFASVSIADFRGDIVYENASVKLTVTSGVGVVADHELPVEFALHQNHPNPFNPTTTIGYSLPEAADVRVEVFNMLGRRVRSLVSGHQPAGQHEVVFDAGESASGMFVYRLIANDYSAVRSMIVLR